LSLITVSNLSKSFGHRDIFSGLTFGVAKGERLAIVGVLLLAGCSNLTAPTATLEASATEAAPTQITVTPSMKSIFTPEPSPTYVPFLNIPPGQYIVYSKNFGKESYIYFAVSPTEGTPILIIDDVDIAAVSPDSLKLAFIRDGLIYNYILEKGSRDVFINQSPLPEGTLECREIVWSPDSMKYLLSCGGDFASRNTNLLVEDGIAHELSWENVSCNFSWAPDSERFVAECFDPEWCSTELKIFDDPEKPGRIVLGCEGDIYCAQPSWSPTGKWITFFRGTGRSGPASPDDGIYITRPDCFTSASKCTRTITTPLVSGDDPSWSPSGDYVALRDHESINIVNINDHTIRNLDVSGSNYSMLWSPDGESIVYSDGYNGILYSVDTKTGKRKILDRGDIFVSGSFTRSP
jgi:hypothetical protein